MELGKSKFTIGVLAGFLVGIFVASWIPLDLWWISGIFLGLVVGLILFSTNLLYRFVFICLLSLFLGLGYFKIYDGFQAKYAPLYDQKIKIEGVISEPVQIKPTKTQAILAYRGTKILVDLPRYPEYKIGDQLSFEAEIQDPKTIPVVENFSYGNYLLNKNIRGMVKIPENLTIIAPSGCKWCLSQIKYRFLRSIYGVGESFQEVLFKVLPEPYASFQAGLLLGNRVTKLPDSLTSAFNRTGTTHIVAVSGYNVTIIISVLALCFALISRRFSFLATLTSIIIFIILTGGSASVVRAGILGGLVAWGHLEGRRINHLILILFVASVMLLFNPYQIHGDVGFQLSFLAFAGLIYISPMLQNLKIIEKIPSVARTVLTETLAAQIAVLPVLIYNFGIVSLVAPIVNILVLPVIPLSMLLGFITGITGLIWMWLGKIVGLIAWVLLKYTIVIVETFSRLPWAAITLKSSEWWWIVIYYLIIFFWLKNNKNNQDTRNNNQTNPKFSNSQ